MTLLVTLTTAVMTVLAGAAPQVDRIRLRPLSASVNSAVVVRTRHAMEQGTELTTMQPYQWQALVEVECYARVPAGADADVSVDPLLAEVYSRLMADPTLGGHVVALQPKAVVYEFDAAGENVVCATLSLLSLQRSVGAAF